MSTGSAARRTRRGAWVVLLGILLAGGAAAWYHFQGRSPALEPPVPEGVQEPEIVNFLALQREKVRANPASGAAWGKYGMALLAHLFDRDAVVCFAEAARLDPNNPAWHYALAQVALKRDQQAAPGLLLKTIATTGPGEEYRAAARLTLAESLLEGGDVAGAAQHFRDALGPPPGDPRAAFGLGLVAVSQGDATAAQQFLTPLLGSPFARKQARVNLARVARSQGNEAEAGRLETEATKLPDDRAWPDPFLDEVPRLAVGQRGLDRTIDELERAGEYGQALQLYLQQLDKARTPKALLGAGANYLRLRDYERALEVIKEAVALDPNSPHAQYTLSLAHFIPAERAIDEDPGSALAKQAFRDVVTHAKRATELKPDHGRAYLHWGLSLMHLGDPKAAVAPLRKGVAIRPEDFDLQLSLGQALARAGETAEAKKYLTNAQRIEPQDPRPARELEKLKGK